MKLVLVLLSVFLFCQSALAQRPSKGLHADVSGILYLTRFQQDSLVPTKRRGKVGGLTEVLANGYYEFVGKHSRLHYRAGLGYSRKELVLNKYSFGDALFAFLPLTGARPDTFRMQRVHYRFDYLNLPLAGAWRLTRNPSNWFQAQVGLQTNISFRLRRQVALLFEPSAAPATPTERAAIEQAYLNGASSVVVGLQPRLDLAARLYKNLGIFYSAQFYTLQINSIHKRVASRGVGLGAGFGAYVNL